MDDGKKAVAMWSMGFGDGNEALSGRSAGKRPSYRALKSDWNTLRMPLERTEIALGLPLTSDEFELLSWGHVPEVMEDHWFMYFDGQSFNFYRSWTGICIYQVHVERCDDGYVLTSATANRDKRQYGETNDQRDGLMASILVGEALGGDMSALWEAYFAIEGRTGSPSESMTKQPTVLAFHDEARPLGFCSNWYPSSFEYRGTAFATSEHWMMWQKARVMGDPASMDAILQTPKPGEARALGRMVEGYDGPLWQRVREQVVYVGVREKFMQNPELAERLLATGSAVLAGGTRNDGDWGVGIDEDKPQVKDIAAWKGPNLLGRVCMRVRSDLRIARATGAYLEGLACGSDEMAHALCKSPVGAMTLLELSRVPAARPAVLCYGRIARHQTQGSPMSLDAFLAQMGSVPIARHDELFRDAGGGYLPTGWSELLSQLAFEQAVGML